MRLGSHSGSTFKVVCPGEDVVEKEPIQGADPTIDAQAGYDEETRALYSGGLSDDPGPDVVMRARRTRSLDDGASGWKSVKELA
jgi:hypothetical protein